MKWYYMIVPFLAITGLAFGQAEKQVELPQDQNKLHLSVVGIENDAQYQQLIKWFDGELAYFRKQVHYHEITADQVVYRERYEPNISGLPTVRLQAPDGTVLYETASNEIPGTAKDLGGKLNMAIFVSEACPWRRCRPPQPEPTPEPSEIIPFTPPELPVPAFPWREVLIFVGCFTAGAIGGTVAGWRKAHA